MNIVLSTASDEPIYLQIYNQIVRQIVNREIEPGTQLPTIRNVAQDLRISVIPVKRAWEELDRSGYICTSVGRGTFVADLAPHELDSKKSGRTEEFIDQTLRKAAELGLSPPDLIDLLKKKIENS